MIVSEKGTMGVGSSRMSGVNNVALWTGKQASPYVPFINIAPIVGGTNGISPIFLTSSSSVNFISKDSKLKPSPDNNTANPLKSAKANNLAKAGALRTLKFFI